MRKKLWTKVGCGCLGVVALSTAVYFGASALQNGKDSVKDTLSGTRDKNVMMLSQKEKQEGMSIHFKWTSEHGEFPHLYYENVNGTQKINMTSPGVPMNKAGNGWYSYTIPGAKSAQIKISIPEKNFETTLQEKEGDSWWFTQGHWYTENPEGNNVTEVYMPANADIAAANETVVHCYSEKEVPKVYYWNALPDDKETQWPGEPMVSDGDGWYSYTFKDTSKINVLFTIGDTQTEDFVAKEGYWWYKDGAWTETKTNATPGPATPKPTRNPNNKTNDFREESIYFVMTTRFFDGDPSNNVHCERDAVVGNGDDDPAWRGDFKGLIEKLDYIKALGFSAVWVTPVVENASGYDYHGYHALDFNKIDPRYESKNASYQDLINACHERDMKLIQDVVFNHTSSFGEQGLFDIFDQQYVLDKGVQGNSVTRNITSSLVDSFVSKACDECRFKDNNGDVPNFESYDSITDGQAYTGNVQYTARTFAIRSDGNKTYRDIDTCKSFSWEDYTVVTGQIAGDCQELNTENPKVYNYIIDAYKKYMDMGVDAFRVDTVKHISRLTFNETFLPAFTEHAKTIGNEHFYMFGEVASRVNDVFQRNNACVSPFFYTWKEEKDYGWNHASEDGYDNIALTKKLYEETPKDNNSYKRIINNAVLEGNEYHTPDHSESNGLAIIDYTMHFNFKDAGEAFRRGLEEDKYVNDSTYNVTYVDSHDYGPADSNGNDKCRYGGGTEAWAENLDLIFTFRGIPCIYYGSEIEFKSGLIIDNYEKALEETRRAYFGDHIEGTVNTTDFGVYNGATGAMAATLDSTLALHLQKLNRIRRVVPALQKGQYTTDGCNGGMSYKRRYTEGDVDSYALVAISSGCTFSDVINGTYVDLVTGNEITVSNGTLTTESIGKANMRVYVLQNDTAKEYGATGKIGDATTYLK